MKKLVVLLTLFAFLLPGKALAFYVYPTSSYPQIQQTGQKAVIWHENGKETIVVSTTFTNAPKDFGWLIPVPSKPTVGQASGELFTSLEDLTRPKGYVDRGVLEPAFQAPGLYDKNLSLPTEPSIIETKQVGIFDITVLAATDPKGLSDWLTKNNFSYPNDRSYIIKSYTEQGWYFVAVKVNAEAQDYAQSFSQVSGHTQPLQVTFDSQNIIYPIKLSGPGIPNTKNTGSKVAAYSFEQGIEGFYSSAVSGPQTDVYGPTQDGVRRSPIEPYYYPPPTLTLDNAEKYHGLYSLQVTAAQATGTQAAQASINNLKPGKTYTVSGYAKSPSAKSGTVSLMADATKTSAKSVTALRNWDRLSTTFVAASEYASISLQLNNLGLGESVNFDAIQIEEGNTPSAFTDEIIPTNTYTPQLYPSDVILTLYVFSNHKKTLPGFTTSYASWVSPKKITKFAFTSDGTQPWMQAKKKMYLTKLYRQMRPAEMTTDFIFRDADNNDPVNSEGAADFSSARFFIAVFVILALEIGGVVGFFYLRKRKARARAQALEHV